MPRRLVTAGISAYPPPLALEIPACSCCAADYLPLPWRCSPVARPITPPAPSTHTAPVQLTREGIIARINGVRAANGKPPLRYDSRLEAAARSQANLMASRDQLSHDLGVTLRQRVANAGYDGAVGENVAGGQKSLEQAINGWLASPGHRDTLLSTKFTEFGLAVATVPDGRQSRYGTYWAFIAGGPFEAWSARRRDYCASVRRTASRQPLSFLVRVASSICGRNWRSSAQRSAKPLRSGHTPAL